MGFVYSLVCDLEHKPFVNQKNQATNALMFFYSLFSWLLSLFSILFFGNESVFKADRFPNIFLFCLVSRLLIPISFLSSFFYFLRSHIPSHFSNLETVNIIDFPITHDFNRGQ